MVKLICRGVIQKKKDQSFYRVTPLGWKWLWASICSKHYFKNPVISATFKTMPTKSSTQPYILEQGVNLINQGLSQITQGLAVNM
jgi:predicted transcriptional regulator